MAKTITSTIHIDNNVFLFECEPCEGEYLDTKVTINGTFFCCISWPEREQFIEDFKTFMAKYRI